MRIKSLWISEYKNLKDFTIEFDTSNPLNIIIGANGSGKSNFLEALALIFKELYLIKEVLYYTDKELGDTIFKRDTFNLSLLSLSFDYKMCMETNKNEIIEIKYSKKEIYEFKKNSEYLSLYYGLNYLPRNILVNYSGNAKRIENIVNKYIFEKTKIESKVSDIEDFQEYYDKPKDYDFNGLSLYNERMLDLIILSNFYLDINFDSALFQILGIEKFENIEFNFDIPKELPKGYGTYRYEGKEKFSYEEIKYHFLSGDSRTILEILEKFGEIKTSRYSGYISKISLNSIQLYKLFEKLEDEYFISHEDFFEYLFSLFKSIRVRDVKLHFMINKGDKPIVIETNDLSEGERQFILNTGISDLFSNSKSLFLLDEPDTYLHPKWQRLLPEFLNKSSIKGQIFMTTHSPITLGKVKKESIKIFKDGHVYVPSSDSMNRDISDILEEIMGVSPRPKEIQEKINEFYEAIAYLEKNKAKEILRNLSSELSESDPFLIESKMLLDGDEN